MITTYLSQGNLLLKTTDSVIDEATIWIDLFNITQEESNLITNVLNINIPTSQDILQIEISERLYTENEALYLTITQLITSEKEFPETHSIVFILHKHRLITVRYIEPISFNNCIDKLAKQSNHTYTSNSILVTLLRNIVTKLSNIVQSISVEVDVYGRVIFAKNERDSKALNYSEILEKIGQKGDLLSKSRESLFSLTMAIQYTLKSSIFTQDKLSRDLLNTLLTDIDSIINFSQFISSEITRTLDATLGRIAIEQNNIIKIFSMATIFFLPPTLIASIYGMNFEIMPELRFHYGYPVALLLMILSIVITYKYFKRRKWL